MLDPEMNSFFKIKSDKVRNDLEYLFFFDKRNKIYGVFVKI